MITMLLGGLWHGAGWTFILWGGLHGLYLVINHGWRRLIGARGEPSRWERMLVAGLTFTAVIVAWVPFRSADWDTTVRVWSGMFAFNGISLPSSLAPTFPSLAPHLAVFEGVAPMTTMNLKEALVMLPLGLFIVWSLPNTQQWMSRFHPAWEDVGATSGWHWEASILFAIIYGSTFAFSLLMLTRESAFLYFQF